MTDIITDMTLDWLEKERKSDQPFMLMYLHKAPHRLWQMAERHMSEFTQRNFPEPATLFDDYSGRTPAAGEAEMNILTHMGWSGDNKLNPKVLKQLGIADVGGYDTIRFINEFKRFTPAQAENFKKHYDPISEEFVKAYPTMSKEDRCAGNISATCRITWVPSRRWMKMWDVSWIIWKPMT